ncbi:MAG: hypothetical protein LBQ87_08560, partial [Candidatus Fibromonas sp.]|nr:hypothetical protein [Candidatus Fibromonas sp.]
MLPNIQMNAFLYTLNMLMLSSTLFKWEIRYMPIIPDSTATNMKENMVLTKILTFFMTGNLASENYKRH